MEEIKKADDVVAVMFTPEQLEYIHAMFTVICDNDPSFSSTLSDNRTAALLYHSLLVQRLQTIVTPMSQPPVTHNIERTLLILKPAYGIEGKTYHPTDLYFIVIKRFAEVEFKLLNARFMTPSRELIENHYIEHKDKEFFGALCDYMTSGEVCVLAYEGTNAVKQVRELVGSADPKKFSDVVTLRNRYGIDLRHNAFHASASVAEAERELMLWFGDVFPVLK